MFAGAYCSYMQERRVIEALLGAYVAMLSVPAAALFTRTLDAGSAGWLVGAGLAVAVLVAAMARTVGDLADATEVAVVTVGGDDDEDTNWPAVAGAVVMGLSFVVFGAIVVVEGDAGLGSIFPMLGGMSTWFLFLGDDDTEIAVTDGGLRIDQSFTRWDDLAGYRIGDDEIELVRPEWYHPTRSFDRGEIDDEDALLDGLRRFLPRLDERGRVELSARER